MQSSSAKVIIIVIAALAGAFGGRWLVRHCMPRTQVPEAVIETQVDDQLKDSFKELIDSQATDIVPIAVVGSGPAGFSAALYGARSKIPTLVVHGDERGGQLTQTSDVENWPAVKKALGAQIMDDLERQAVGFGASMLTDRVARIDLSRWPFVLTTDEGLVLNALTIIVATGAAPRRLNIPGEQEYWGKRVSSCAVCDAALLSKEDKVFVVGGGDSAVEEATQLAKYAGHVTIMVRKDAMRAAKSMQERLTKLSNVSVRYNVELKAIEGNGQVVTGAQVLNNATGVVAHEPIDAVFLAVGHDPNTALFKGQLAMTPGGYLKMQGRSQCTSKPGVFAAGDVQDEHYKQAVIASGDGAKAALDAIEFLTALGWNVPIETQLEDRMFDAAVYSREELKPVNAQDLEKLLAQPLPVLLDFFTDPCPECDRMAPAVEAAAKKFEGRILVAKVNMQENRALTQKMGVKSAPTLVMVKAGQAVGNHVGRIGRPGLYRFIEGYL